MSDSTACVKFGAWGIASVDASLRMTGSSYIQCCTYPDRPAILAVYDGHVAVSVTVPHPGQVTAEDLDTARRLAAAVTAYLADLEHRAKEQDRAAAGTAA